MAPRIIGKPEPGFFRMRLVKGGPLVPARIFLPCPIDPEFGFPMDRPRHLIAEIDGVIEPAPRAVERIWLSAELIDKATFEFMNADAEWCRTHAPAEPKASPRKAIDARKAPPVF